MENMCLISRGDNDTQRWLEQKHFSTTCDGDVCSSFVRDVCSSFVRDLCSSLVRDVCSSFVRDLSSSLVRDVHV